MNLNKVGKLLGYYLLRINYLNFLVLHNLRCSFHLKLPALF
jgi:hypothetical protein